MKINRNNYESFFIDYLEGNLDERLVDDFIEFLTQNPDLKDELTLFEPVSVEPGDAVFGKKELLLKERFDLESEFAEAAIANLEGDLPANEKIYFDKYIASHPDKKHDLELFEKTRLVTDESVVFQKKHELYKTTPLKTFLLWSGRVAAVLMIALLGYLIVGNEEKAPVVNNTMAVAEDNKPRKELPVEIKKTPERKAIQHKTEPVKTLPKAAEKETKIQTNEPNKNESLREKNTGRIHHDDLAMNNLEALQIAQIELVSAAVGAELPETELKAMYITVPQAENFDERLLVDRVKEKAGIEKINFGKITKAGLNLVTSLSKEKFRYQTNQEGKITEVNFDSRLLAFTIPTKPVVRTGE